MTVGFSDALGFTDSSGYTDALGGSDGTAEPRAHHHAHRSEFADPLAETMRDTRPGVAEVAAGPVSKINIWRQETPAPPVPPQPTHASAHAPVVQVAPVVAQPLRARAAQAPATYVQPAAPATLTASAFQKPAFQQPVAAQAPVMIAPAAAQTRQQNRTAARVQQRAHRPAKKVSAGAKIGGTIFLLAMLWNVLEKVFSGLVNR